MAEYYFYGTDEDALRILECALEKEAVAFTPDLNYRSRTPVSFQVLNNDFFDALQINRRIFVTGPFSDSPLSLREVKGGEFAGTFVVDEVRGGQAMSLTLPMCKQLDGNIWHLAPGDLFHPPSYWKDASKKSVPPSERLKEAYARLLKVIKSAVIRKNLGHHVVSIGPAGLRLLKEGQAMILVEGKWLDLRGRAVTQTGTRSSDSK